MKETRAFSEITDHADTPQDRSCQSCGGVKAKDALDTNTGILVSLGRCIVDGVQRLFIGEIDQLDSERAIDAVLRLEECTDSAVSGWPCYNESRTNDR